MIPGDLRDKAFRLARFAAVGVVATALYLGIALAAVRLGAPLLLAHGVAYAISIALSYLGQKVVTFGIRGNHRRTGPRFAIATAVIAGIQVLLVSGLDALHVDKSLILFISTGYYPVASFLVHSLWTFRGADAASRA